MDRNKGPWRKILYENQGYPDNYTDKTFLWELRRNIKYQEVTLFEAIVGSSLLIQELCTVIAFVLTYCYMYNEWIEPNTIFYITSAFTVIGFLTYRMRFSSKGIREMLGHDVRTILIFLVFGHIFSPVLHTLTDSISTDTIYTMTFFMMLVHLIFFDYGVPAAIVSNSLSLSAAVFGSVCLASRLKSAYHAFVLITIAIEIFVLFPLLRNKIKKSLLLSLVLILTVIFNLYSISILSMVLFLCAVMLINIMCPLLFVRYQYYKDNIYGPWDEAIVEDADNINDLIYS